MLGETGLRHARRALAVVGIVSRKNAIEIVEKDRIVGGLSQPRFVDPPQKRLRTLSDRIPQRWVQPSEELARRAIAAVPEIAGELLEPGEPLGNPRVDFDDVRRSRQLHGHEKRKRRARGAFSPRRPAA